MIASRFWYGLLALLLSGATLGLFLAISMHDRLGMRSVSEGLSGDSQVVSWYLKQSAREGASQLIRFSANDTIARALGATKGPATDATKRKVRSALEKVAAEMSAAQRFDAVFAVAQTGEVVAHLGFDQARKLTSFELGGYPVVADALHGHVRDDTLVLDRLYRVAARPVELELGGLPAGAVVGATLIDDDFAEGLSVRTGAAVAFYTRGMRHALGVPSEVDRSGLDQIVTDLPSLDNDDNYREKGRTDVHLFPDGLAVVYARLPGEAWQLGAGFAVARPTPRIGGLMGLFSLADRTDRDAVNSLWLVGIALFAAGGGLLLSLLEYSRPLAAFKRQLSRVSSGESSQLEVGQLRGPFRQVGLDVNLALERSGDGEAPTSVAFDQMFGSAPEPGEMSAFSAPQTDRTPPSSGGAPQSPVNPAWPGVISAQAIEPAAAQPAAAQPAAAQPAAAQPAAPQPPSLREPAGQQYPPPIPESPPHQFQAPAQAPASPPQPALPPRRAGLHEVGGENHVDAGPPNGALDVEPSWQALYQDFIRLKGDCGETLDGFSFERFSATLRRNRDTLLRQRGVQRVDFSAYVKEGRAALKAKPVRG